MSEKHTKITVTLRPVPLRPLLLVVLALLAGLVILWALIGYGLPALGFDGKIGPGCDRGNPNCLKTAPTPTEGREAEDP